MNATMPIKAYSLVNQATFSNNHLEIQQNGQTILWVNKETLFKARPVIKVQSMSANGPIVAACQLAAMGSGLRVLFSEGNQQTVAPGSTPKEQWHTVNPHGMTNSEYEFHHGAGRFVWRRTHDSALGASSVKATDFKLLDLSNGDNPATQRVLAVYVQDKKFMSHHNVGQLNFMVELGMPLELMSIAAILGIEERIRRKKSSADAAALAGS